jgi:hypothetical protein
LERAEYFVFLAFCVPKFAFINQSAAEMLRGNSMASNLHPRDHDAFAATRQGDGLSQWGISTEALPPLAPWSKLGWGLFLPLVFAGNVAVALLAWVIVGLVMR